MKRALLAFLATAVLVAPRAAAAQTMEERARAAADASRAKASDSDRLQQSYVTPGLSGQPIRTVDDSTSFTPSLSCQKTATLLEVLVHPDPSGDIGTVRVSRDKDLDGSFDTTSTLPVPVSGICANGVISCAPGTWNACHFYQWSLDSAQDLKLSEVGLPELAGCYCVNNSCGTNLVFGNLPSVLKDLGGGIVGALTTGDPRIGVAQARIDGPVISYVGAQTTACTASPSVGETSYRANPTAIQGDALAESAGNRVFQALKASSAGLGKVRQMRSCTIERAVEIQDPEIDDIISRTAGGYASIVTDENMVDFQLGSPADNSLAGGSCRLFDFRMTLHVEDPDRIVDARLSDWFADDWGQIRVDGTLISSGPLPWTGMGFPPSGCERKATYRAFPNIDLKPFLTKGDHEIWLRAAVGDGGEAFANVHVVVDASCSHSERVVDLCSGYAADPKCHLADEDVDGVVTVRNGINTGLRPLPQTRLFGSAACTFQLTRPFFLRTRRYACDTDTGSPPTPDLSRGAYIIDHSTETLLADRLTAKDGTVTTTTRGFTLPDRGSVAACEPICKTRAPKMNVDAALAGVVGTVQNDPSGWDTFYHACGPDNVCPTGPGEEIVSACGCLDDFPEAVVMMQTVRLAGSDLACTAVAR